MADAAKPDTQEENAFTGTQSVWSRLTGGLAVFALVAKTWEGGLATPVQLFVEAYNRLAPLNLDQRYDLGRIGEVGGDSILARAQADSILTARPNHLLGLILAAKAARLEKNERRAKEFDARLLAAAPTERNAGLAEYLLHKNDIDVAVAAAGGAPKK